MLESLIVHMKIRLLILDPSSAIPGFSRSLFDLVDLAERRGCAILLTSSSG